MKNSLVIYHDIRHPLELLTDEQRGKLFLAILDYSEQGLIPEFTDTGLAMAFAFIRNSLDRDREAWDEKCRKRAEAGAKGGRQTAANRANAAIAELNEQITAHQAEPVPVLEPVPDNAPAPVPDVGKPKSKTVLLSFCVEHMIPEEFARVFFDRYASNGWTLDNGEPIRNWRNLLLSSWRKEKKNQSAHRIQPVTVSYSTDDLIEWPYGSGQYRLRSEVEGLQDG